MRPVVLLSNPFAQGSSANFEDTDGQRKKSSFVEDQLDETVQQVRKYLDGKHQVVGWGVVGMFDVYSVTDYPSDLNIIPVRNLHRKFPDTFHKILGRVIPIAEYRQNDNADLEDAIYVRDDSVASHGLIRANLTKATAAIQAVGLPRQRTVLILRDLRDARNVITGGGVGGYAYRRTHAIEVDSGLVILPEDSQRILVHEWAHQHFFRLPQHVTRYVTDWFTENLVKRPELQQAPEGVPESMRDRARELAWRGFSDFWFKDQGIRPEAYLALKKKHAGRDKDAADNDPSAFIDVVLDSGGMLHGTAQVGLRNPEGGAGLRKGAKLFGVAIPGDKVRVAGRPSKTGDILIFEVPRSTFEKSVWPDWKLTTQQNSVREYALEYRVRKLIFPDDGEDNFFTRGNLLYNAIEAGQREAQDYIERQGIHLTSRASLYRSNEQAFEYEWNAAVKRDGDRFDPKDTFLRLFEEKLVDWTLQGDKIRRTPEERVRYALTSSEGRDLRDLAKKLGITPSSYAASNVDELWAELVTYVALEPNTVPKPLRALLRDALQGKTPGPGQRVKQDNTPPKYRKGANEDLAPLDASESEAPTWVSDVASFQPRDTPRTPRSIVRDTAKVGMVVNIDGYEGRIVKINQRESTTSIVLMLSGGQRTRPFMFRDATNEAVVLLDRSPFA